MKTRTVVFLAAVVSLSLGPAMFAAEKASNKEPDVSQVQPVIDEVEKECLEKTVYMIGRKKAVRLAELVRERKPKIVVECGTAVGYSGLWIARELKRAGVGHLTTFEISAERAKKAEASFKKAGLEDFVTVKVGDARKGVKNVAGPIDFFFVDCGPSNYAACLAGIQDRLAPGAVLVADNVGMYSSGMKDYLKEVRSKYKSELEWFDINLPWGKRDGMEVSIVPK